MAEELRKQPGLDVRLEEGRQGELTVLVDGREVAGATDKPPTAEQVLAAVKSAA